MMSQINGMSEFECRKGTDCPAVSFHSTISWILQIARGYELGHGPFSNLNGLVDELESEEFLDREICDEIRALGNKHDELAVSHSIEPERIGLFDKNVESLERLVATVVVIEGEEDD